MARPSKTAAIDYFATHDLTHGLLERACCPAEKSFVLVKDSDKKGLRLRVTKVGGKHWQFETRMKGRLITRALGEWPAVSIDAARKEAHRLRGLTEQGIDPRELDRQHHAEREAELQKVLAEAAKQTTTGLDAWVGYIKEGKEIGFTRRGPWGERHYQDHVELASAGGQPMKVKKGTMAPGPLHSLLALPLVQIDEKAVADWLKAESATRPARASLGFRLLRGFLNWCAGHAVYGSIAQVDAHKPKEVRRLVRRPAVKVDSLQREQLSAWFTAVQVDTDRLAAAFLVCLLLTGARKGEIAGLRWEDVDLRFGGSLTIRDKVEGLRVIPCPAYVADLLSTLPRRSAWVFGEGDEAPRIGLSAAHNHRRALVAAGLPHVSLHGLRRSFGSLAEWVEVPAGIVAQIQGHKPSATAEKHYRVRPLDLLRVWHDKIEAWILEQAGVKFERSREPGKLHVVV